jgi:hypothetical protein
VSVASGIATDVTHDRSGYLRSTDSSLEAVAAGGAPRILFRLPRWFSPNWIRMGPDARTLYAFSPDSLDDPVYWAIDLRSGALRRLVTFDHPETRTVRGVSDTDGKRFYFVAGEHQADIWVADVGQR